MSRRFESQFDPEELSKITHRGLKPLSKVNEPKVTQQNIVTLKDAAQEENKLSAKIQKFWGRILIALSNTFKSLLAPPEKKVYQCELYGHVLKGGWSGQYPMCQDCGAQITALDQVRGATPKDQRGTGGTTGHERRFVK